MSLAAQQALLNESLDQLHLKCSETCGAASLAPQLRQSKLSMCMEYIASLMKMCDPGESGSLHYKDLSECLVCHLGIEEQFAEAVAGYGMNVAKLDDSSKIRYKLLLVNLE